MCAIGTSCLLPGGTRKREVIEVCGGISHLRTIALVHVPDCNWVLTFVIWEAINFNGLGSFLARHKTCVVKVGDFVRRKNVAKNTHVADYHNIITCHSPAYIQLSNRPTGITGRTSKRVIHLDCHGISRSTPGNDQVVPLVGSRKGVVDLGTIWTIIEIESRIAGNQVDVTISYSVVCHKYWSPLEGRSMLVPNTERTYSVIVVASNCISEIRNSTTRGRCMCCTSPCITSAQGTVCITCSMS